MKQEVYREEEDMGQSSIWVRWVPSRKVKDGENIIKARLCARGFEEVKDFPTDSPCCSRIGIQTVYSNTSNQWEIKSIDVKTTFLQGEQIERTVYLRPPKKANTLSIWKLQKYVYCLADAIRYWYLHVREELVRLRAKLSCIDPGIFYWQDDSGLIGIFVYHMNDVIWGGNEYFKTNV